MLEHHLGSICARDRACGHCTFVNGDDHRNPMFSVKVELFAGLPPVISLAPSPFLSFSHFFSSFFAFCILYLHADEHILVDLVRYESRFNWSLSSAFCFPSLIQSHSVCIFSCSFHLDCSVLCVFSEDMTVVSISMHVSHVCSSL